MLKCADGCEVAVALANIFLMVMVYVVLFVVILFEVLDG